MSRRFVTPERDQLYLMPHNLEDWIPDDDIVHFVIEAADLVPINDFNINKRGTGSRQYHPNMMLALLLYCYSHGIFSSRRIERATYKDVAIRYLCGNTHPDHNTICLFRSRNEKAISSAFLHILQLANELGILKVGTVSTDGTKIKANASIHKSLRKDRAEELVKQLELDIQTLMKKAAEAEQDDEDDDQLHGDLKRLNTLKEKLKRAQDKLIEQDRKKSRDQINLTDPDSRIMRKSRRSEYSQAYNAQAVVDADDTMLILGSRVTNRGSDHSELLENIQSIPNEIDSPDIVLADSGYINSNHIEKLQDQGIDVILPLVAEEVTNNRKYDFKPISLRRTKEKVFSSDTMKEMAEKMKSKDAREIYKLRKQTVEPVFGIIKEILGFRQFHLRTLDKVNLEWNLIACAYNVKRLAKLVK